MTRVSHSVEDVEVTGSAFNPNFLLSNKIGGYISLGTFPISKYQGVFINEKFKAFKVIENIIPVGCADVDEVRNKFFAVERKRGEFSEEFFMPLNRNAVVYKTNCEKEIELQLDVKDAYDMREFGRFYSINTEGGRTIIEFIKKTDRKEDKTEGKKEFSMFIVVNTDKLTRSEEWCQVRYSFDQERKSWPFERHVFRPGRFKATELIITFSHSKRKAIEENEFVEKNLQKLKTEYEIYINGFRKRMKEKDVNMAYKASRASLDSLVHNIDNKRGIYAGLYWFFQYWIRDEAVSLKALINQKKFGLVKEILFREINNINEDGTVSSIFPKLGLESADGVGWVFKRTSDFIDALRKEKMVHEYLTEQEIKFIKNKLESSIFSLLKTHTYQDIVINGRNETWMDTGFDMDNEDDSREGARIEIQALRLCMYKLMKELCKHLKDDIGFKLAEHLEEMLAAKTRSLFWNGSYLKDGADDERVRPNVFIAYYIYPELLSDSEWIKCFRTVLPKLWNEWGGLSTIDKKSPIFHNFHTGEDNKSYHRGDSWYWINNLAAICMARVGKSKFRNYINKILDASTKEILWGGLIGHHAEISSSAALESKGCLAQAWSAAMYVELVDELF